jgi:hypothetical protein
VNLKDVANAIATTFAEFDFLQVPDRKRLLRGVFSDITIHDKAIQSVTIRLPRTKT